MGVYWEKGGQNVIFKCRIYSRSRTRIQWTMYLCNSCLNHNNYQVSINIITFPILFADIFR